MVFAYFVKRKQRVVPSCFGRTPFIYPYENGIKRTAFPFGERIRIRKVHQPFRKKLLTVRRSEASEISEKTEHF